jgi:glycerol-3-phosphate acyltransferase PlsY
VTVSLVIVASYLLGAVPFSNLAARRRGVDLREVGNGTVSGTSLHRVAGFGALAVAGSLDVAKGAVGPALLHGRTLPMAAAAAAAIIGHNWSLFLGGAGGRGISTAMGGLAVIAWPAALALLAGLAVGRLLHRTALVSLLAQCAIVPILGAVHGRAGVAGALIVLAPMWAKRIAGNHWPSEGPVGVILLHRWLFDHDPSDAPGLRGDLPAT